MRNFLLYFTAFIYIVSPASAQVSNGGKISGTYAPGLATEKNYVINGSCEKNATTGISASGGSLGRGTTTPLNEDSGTECTIDASASGQTYTWSFNTFGERLSGGNCAVEFIYQGDASLYKAYIKNGSSQITADLTLSNISSGSKVETISFPCGDLSASNTFLIEATDNAAASISIIIPHVGKNRNIGTVAQTELVVKAYRVTSAQTISTTTATKVQLNAEEFDTYGEFDPTTNYRFTPLRAGRYEFSAQLSIGNITERAGVLIYKNGSPLPVGLSSYVEAGSTADIYPRITTAVDLVVGDYIEVFSDSITDASYDVNTVNSFLTVKYFPTSSQTVARFDQVAWKVDANISGANPSLGTSAVTSYTGIENGSLTLTNNSGNGNLTAMIPCSSTNSPSGTTCSAGNESVGVSFTLPAAQDVMACASFSHNVSNSASSNIAATFEIVETPNNAQTISQEGKSRVSSGNITVSSNITLPNRVCGNFTFASAGQKTLRLMYEQEVAGTASANLILADASGTAGQRDIRWEVYPLNTLYGIPLLLGGVTASTTVQSGGANGITTVDYGSASVTVANLNNTASITSPSTCNYMRVGNLVNVACPITHGCTTAAGTDSTFYVTLPITSDIQNAYDLSGTYGTGNASETGRIYADSTNNRAEVNFRCQATGAGLHTVMFQYIVR